jgi:hypothetical protein
VPSYELLSSSEILGRMAMTKMLGGLSSRRYTLGLEPVGENESTAICTYQCCEPHSSGMSPSRVSVPTVMMRP